MLPLLFASPSRESASASAGQHFSAVTGGPIAALPYVQTIIVSLPCLNPYRSVRCSEAMFICLPSIPLSPAYEILQGAAACAQTIMPSGILCKISGRLLSSSLRFTVILLLILIFKKVSTSRRECQDTGLSVCPFCRPCGMAFPSGISLLYRSPFYKYSSALLPSPILLILVSSPFSDRKSPI